MPEEQLPLPERVMRSMDQCCTTLLKEYPELAGMSISLVWDDAFKGADLPVGTTGVSERAKNKLGILRRLINANHANVTNIFDNVVLACVEASEEGEPVA